MLSDAEIQQLIDDYDNLQGQLDLLVSDKAMAVPAEVKQILADIDAEFDPQIEVVSAKVQQARDAMTEAVKAAGHTVGNDHWQVVFVKGRITWDNQKLEGFAAVHPEIKAFQKIGAPSAMVRTRGDK